MHSGKFSEACLGVEGQDGPVGLHGMRGDDQVMCAMGRSGPAGVRDQSGVTGSCGFLLLEAARGELRSTRAPGQSAVGAPVP